MPKSLKPQKLTLLRRTPMPLLSIIIGLLCGIVVWGLLDQVQPRAVKKIFAEELQSRLEQQARETLIRFDTYVRAHIATTRLLANHRDLANHLEPIYWFKTDKVDPLNHFQRPFWLPPEQQWQRLVKPSHILLLDSEGGVRETYHRDRRLLPDALRGGVPPVLGEERVLARLSNIDGVPTLLISEIAEDATGTEMGSLLLVAPIDEQFLLASQQGVATDNVVVGVLDALGERFLASGNETLIPEGTLRQDVEKDYLVTVQRISGLQQRGLEYRFATLIPHAVVDAIKTRVTQLDRQQRLVSASLFIGIFTLVFFLLSQRLNQILQRISRFSQRALGAGQPLVERGNQLLVLEDWIRQFIQLVRETRDEMSNQHATEMKESEALKQAIMETALDSIITIDEHGKIIEFNHTAELTFLYRRDHVIGRDLSTLVLAEESVEQFEELFLGLLNHQEGLQEVRYEMVAIRGDGERFPVDLAVKSIPLQDKTALTVYIHDASNRKRAEIEIRDLARFTSESPNPVLRVNSKGVILYANSASGYLLDYWGCERAQTLPQYWRSRIKYVLSRDELWETQVICEDKTYFLLLTPIVDANYVNIYGRDITAVKEAESLAREHQQELIHVSRLTTMGEMATGLAHELNQPLSAIANYANGSSRRLRAQGGVSEDILFALEQINLQADRAGEIIKRLRGMVAKQPPVRSITDINELVREVCSFVEFEARRDGVVIEQELNLEPIYAKVDVVQVEQVLLNLLRNALDALLEIPEDKRKLLIDTALYGDDEVQVRVTDSGVGIPTELLSHLFEPFFTTKKSGMGIGLVISKTIVDDHGGSIFAEVLSEGASFVLRLPRSENEY